MEVGADLVGLASTESMALSATGLEEARTLASVTCNANRELAVRRDGGVSDASYLL